MERSRLVKLNFLILCVFLYAPLLIMIIMSFDPRPTMAWPPPALTLHWYKEVFTNPVVSRAFITSIVLSSLAALLSTGLGITLAMAIVRERFVGKEFVRLLALAPIIVPRVVLGIALLAFSRLVGIGRGWPLLLVGHTLIALPYATLVVTSQLYGFNRRLEEAALNLGATPFRTFLEITLPLISPAVVAGALFGFTISFQDVEGTLSWASPGLTTIALTVYDFILKDLSPRINVIGVLMLVMSVTLGALGAVLRGRVGRRPF